MKPKAWVITSAAIIAGIRLWMQIRGKTKTPFSEWAVGFGALFIFLAILAEAAPAAAGPLAGVVVVGDVLQNGSSLFEDISSVVTGSEKGSILTATPFGSSSSTSSTSSTATPAQTEAANLAAGTSDANTLTSTPDAAVQAAQGAAGASDTAGTILGGITDLF